MFFRYLPPAPEEQRAFALQFLGSLLGIAVLVAMILATREMALRGLLIGAIGATIWLLLRNAFALENKARRAERASLTLDAEALTVMDAREYSQRVLWRDVEKCETRGGRLSLQWQGKNGAQTLEIGARELENGMEFVRHSLAFYNAAHDIHSQALPSNFIPLEPR